MINFETAAELLKSNDNFGVLIHAYPDGDAIGSSYALCYALRSIGKKAKVICTQEIPHSYFFLTDEFEPGEDFEPETFLSVDLADLSLIGNGWEQYEGKVLLSIDHHKLNKNYAQNSMVFPEDAAACEAVYKLVKMLGLEPDRFLAECIYTGISTDTGCFKYSNTTPAAHRVCADMLEYGIRLELINRLMFETKTHGRIAIERLALDNLDFYCDKKIAIMTITNEMRNSVNAADDDLEGITSLPRQIEGVLLGITIRQKTAGDYKISLRSYDPIDASAIASSFGGGGHTRAAGCTLDGDIDSVKQQLLEACREQIEKL